MKEYHKIDGIFVREEARPHKMIWGVYRNPTVAHLENVEWIFTEKVDGTNIRVHWDGHNVTFGGRTDSAQIPSHLANYLIAIFGGEANAQVFEQKFGDTPVTLYGEGYGAGIQRGGHLYSERSEFILFDVMINGLWLERKNVEDIAKSFDIEVVPIVLQGTLLSGIAYAHGGFKSHVAAGDKDAEGLIGVPTCNVLDRMGRRVIVKLKTHDLRYQCTPRTVHNDPSIT